MLQAFSFHVLGARRPGQLQQRHDDRCLSLAQVNAQDSGNLPSMTAAATKLQQGIATAAVAVQHAVHLNQGASCEVQQLNSVQAEILDMQQQSAAAQQQHRTAVQEELLQSQIRQQVSARLVQQHHAQFEDKEILFGETAMAAAAVARAERHKAMVWQEAMKISELPAYIDESRHFLWSAWTFEINILMSKQNMAEIGAQLAGVRDHLKLLTEQIREWRETPVENFDYELARMRAVWAYFLDEEYSYDES